MSIITVACSVLAAAMSSVPWLLGEHALSGPALLVPSLEHVVAPSQVIRPVRERLSLAVPGYQDSVSPISYLSGPCRPAAITGLIVPVVVDAVQLHPFWTFSHVSKERLETISPLVAHCDASTSVVPMLSFVRISAPRFCRRPRLICARSTSLGSVSVSRSQCYSDLCASTPTTGGLSRRETVAKYDTNSAAITAALPHRAVLPLSVYNYLGLYYDKPNKPLSGEIYRLCHTTNYSGEIRISIEVLANV